VPSSLEKKVIYSSADQGSVLFQKSGPYIECYTLAKSSDFNRSDSSSIYTQSQWRLPLRTSGK